MKKEHFSLGIAINQREQRTRERAKNESHEWSQRTHGVENEGERKRERNREGAKDGRRSRVERRETGE